MSTERELFEAGAAPLDTAEIMRLVQWYADRTVDHRRHATHETYTDLVACAARIESSLGARSADTSGALQADAKRLDWLQSFADQAHARGFMWDAFTLLVEDGAPTIRSQIDAQIASGLVKSARNPGFPEPPPAAPGGPAGVLRPDDQERDDA